MRASGADVMIAEKADDDGKRCHVMMARDAKLKFMAFILGMPQGTYGESY